MRVCCSCGLSQAFSPNSLLCSKDIALGFFSLESGIGVAVYLQLSTCSSCLAGLHEGEAEILTVAEVSSLR